jgi:iron complex transport system permease protein
MLVRAEKRAAFFFGIGLLAAGILAVAIFWDVPGDGPVGRVILWRIRLPRACLGFLAGASLAASGMAFQSLFRNPLATPFTLGVSSGASLGAALYVRAGLVSAAAGVSGVSLAAFAGASLAIFLVYGLTRAGRGFSTATLLLAGVAISYFFMSLILFIQYTADHVTSFRVTRWLMGGLQIVGFEAILQLVPFVAAGLAVILLLLRELDLLVLGEDLAAGRGVDVSRVKKLLFFAASLMVGGVVAVCGPIGFVGLVIPHIGRLLVGARHRELAPFSILAGGAFLVLCDAAGRALMSPLEIPVGVITALIGGPFFVVLLLRGFAERPMEA